MKRLLTAYVHDGSLRRGIVVFVLILALLVGGWTVVNMTAQRVLRRDATDTATEWANFLSANVSDLAHIAAGERPSMQSLAFFLAVRKAGEVFRCVIYNREGYSQLVSDAGGVFSVDVATFSREAAMAVKTATPLVDMKSSATPDMPRHYSEAFVPVRVDGRPVAVVAAYVDQTARRDNFYQGIELASVALSGLIGLAFGIPAVAWYRRTREKQRADRRIQFLAHHDALTGLANRARLCERLEAALAVLPPAGALVAIHYIDIDYFKQVNDTLGHDGGDFLLAAAGRRLQRMTRVEDMVARLGGDEFVVVQIGFAAKGQAYDFAKRIAAELAAPVAFGEQQLRVGVTIGIALAPADGLTPERLLKSADLALYDGKAGGRECIRFFAPEMDEAMQLRVKLERIVREAVEHERFEVYYQPVFEMNDHRLVGFEALARLLGPDGVLVPPATFIPLAEELRLIDRIGASVLRQACAAAITWPANLTVAVNLSPAQFESGDIEAIIVAALEASGLPPHRLELEITESVLMRNSEVTLGPLRRLKALGVAIVMDDFGTGYSSLSYLWKFPFDKIKIDRSFMESFEKAERHVETVVKTIIALGREMNMRVTVEGVETAQQMDFLYDADADQVQGFYFGRPAPAADVGLNILGELRKSMAPSDDGKEGDRRGAPAASTL